MTEFPTKSPGRSRGRHFVLRLLGIAALKEANRLRVAERSAEDKVRIGNAAI